MKITLLAGDIIILYAGLFATLTLRYGSFPSQILWDNHKWPFLFVNIIWITILYIAGFYDQEKFISSAKITYIFKTMAAGGGVAILLFYFVPYFVIAPKTNLFIDAATVTLLLWLWRKTFQRIIVKSSKITIFFLGAAAEISDFAKFINECPQFGYKTTDNISEANIIITSAEANNNPETEKSLYDMVLSGRTIVNFEIFYESITGKVPVSTIGKGWFLRNLIEINKQKFEKIKRWLDIVLSILIFVPFLAILPVVSTVIKLSSRGSVFYKQKRVGKNGKFFEIIKFRSMFKDAEKNGAEWAKKGDNRITFIGSIMRKTRIDELPQIWNVLKGDLSFIGPRPERPEFVRELAERVPHYNMRQLVKPGLSGWAQINFPYGASVEDATEKLQYDLYYIKNRSLFLDFAIALKTIMTLLKKEGR